MIPRAPLGVGTPAHHQRVAWALSKAREAMDEEPFPLQSIKKGLVVQEAVVNPELEVRFPPLPSLGVPPRLARQGGVRGRREGGARLEG